MPCARLVGFEADPTVLGQPFFVMGFVDGVIPADVPRYSEAGFLVEEATPEERTRMVRTGLEAMAKVHAIDWRNGRARLARRLGRREPTQADQLRPLSGLGRPHTSPGVSIP